MTRLRAVAVALAVVVSGAGCATSGNNSAKATTASTATPVSVVDSPRPIPTTTMPVPSEPPVTPPASPETTAVVVAPADIREVLGQLSINDDPRPGIPYSRDDWSHWDDLDGDGCDTRQEVLLRDTRVGATVGAGCEVVRGDWFSIYDGAVAYTPGDFDVDHVVALAEAHASGGWRFDPGKRRQFANDMDNLVVVSAESNRTKSAKRPDEWRPGMQDSWCSTATTWVAVKVTYSLSVTTSERDALGQMLETCVTAPDTAPTGPAVAPTAPSTAPPTTTAAGGTVYYERCAEARAAGAAPILERQPGYRPGLDGDKDGIACE